MHPPPGCLEMGVVSRAGLALRLSGVAAVVHMNRYNVLFIAAMPNLLFLLDWKFRRARAAHT
jgi:hypothetical protein